MALYHAYTQTVADGTATSVVRPSDWNSGHRQVVTLSGNTVGASTLGGTNVVFQGGNNVTLSASQGEVIATIVVSGGNFAATDITTNAMATGERGNYFYTSNNTFANNTHSHGNPTLNLTNLSGTTASASNGFTLSLSAAAPGGASPMSTYIPYYPGSTGALTLGATGTSSASAHFYPVSIVAPVIFNRIEQLMTCSWISSTVSGQQSITHAFGIYSNNAGTLSSISTGSYSMCLTGSSVSATLSYPNTYGTAGGYGYTSTAATTTAQAHSLFGTAGNRIMTFGFGNTMSLSEGMYWIAVHQRMSSSSANVGLVPALAGNVMAAAQNAGPIGSYTASYTGGTLASIKYGWGPATSTGSAGYSGTNVPANYPITALANTATQMPMCTFISR